VSASCELSPCLNNGTCVNSVSPPYYRCICSTPRHDSLPLGAHCEPLSPCDSMPCPDHATCVVVDKLGAYRCVCDGGNCGQIAGALTSLSLPHHHLGACNCAIRQFHVSIVRLNQLILILNEHIGIVCLTKTKTKAN